MKRIKMQRFLGLVIAVMLLLNIPTLSNTVYASDVSVNDNANSQSLSNDVAKMYATIDKYTTVGRETLLQENTLTLLHQKLIYGQN